MFKLAIWLTIAFVIIYIALGVGVFTAVKYVADNGLKDVGQRIWCGPKGC